MGFKPVFSVEEEQGYQAFHNLVSSVDPYENGCSSGAILLLPLASLVLQIVGMGSEPVQDSLGAFRLHITWDFPGGSIELHTPEGPAELN